MEPVGGRFLIFLANEHLQELGSHWHKERGVRLGPLEIASCSAWEAIILQLHFDPTQILEDSHQKIHDHKNYIVDYQQTTTCPILIFHDFTILHLNNCTSTVWSTVSPLSLPPTVLDRDRGRETARRVPSTRLPQSGSRPPQAKPWGNDMGASYVNDINVQRWWDDHKFHGNTQSFQS